MVSAIPRLAQVEQPAMNWIENCLWRAKAVKYGKCVVMLDRIRRDQEDDTEFTSLSPRALRLRRPLPVLLPWLGRHYVPFEPQSGAAALPNRSFLPGG